jgi:hypothetical protein
MRPVYRDGGLTKKQKALDKNNDGKISGEDFKMMVNGGLFGNRFKRMRNKQDRKTRSQQRKFDRQSKKAARKGGGSPMYANGGAYYDYPAPMTKEEAKFFRDQERFEEGAFATINQEIGRRDKAGLRFGRNTGYYPAQEREVSILLDMLENDQLNREDMVRKGKRRRGVKQAVGMAINPLLALLTSGKVAQIEAERASGVRPSFGQALGMVFGGQ